MRKRTQTGSFQIGMQRLLRFIAIAPRRELALFAGLVILEGMLPAAGAYAMKITVNSFAPRGASGESIRAIRTAQTAILLAGGFYLTCRFLQMFLPGWGDIVRGVYKDKLSRLADTWVLAIGARWSDLRVFETPGSRDVISTVAYNGHIPATTLEIGAQTLRYALAVTGLIIVFGQTNWQICALILALNISFGLVNIRYAAHQQREEFKLLPLQRQCSYYYRVFTTSETLQEIKTSQSGAFFLRQYEKTKQRLVEQQKRLDGRGFLAQGASSFSNSALLAFIYLYIFHITIMGRVTLGGATMYLANAELLQGDLRILFQMLGVLVGFGMQGKYFEDFNDLDKNTSSTDAAPAANIDVPAADPLLPPPSIVFENVSFRYGPDDPYVLDNINLTVSAGESVAIVGANGAGKTTLMKLLCRFYEPTSGRILINGEDIRTWNPFWLRRNITVAFQDFSRFAGTVRENIGLGNIERLDDSAALAAAAAQSGITARIARLPAGYETRLGRSFGGAQFSGGEWQKLALARAYLKSAPIVVLDEPTSAADALAEQNMYQCFQEIAQGRTTLLVSHRLSTVRMADRILVLKEGRVIEQGSHEALLGLEGTYSRMFRQQEGGYQPETSSELAIAQNLLNGGLFQ